MTSFRYTESWLLSKDATSTGGRPRGGAAVASILLLRAPRASAPTAPRVLKGPSSTPAVRSCQSSVSSRGTSAPRRPSARHAGPRAVGRVPSRDDAVPSAGTRSIRIHPATCARTVARQPLLGDPERSSSGEEKDPRRRRRRRRRRGFGGEGSHWLDRTPKLASRDRPPAATARRSRRLTRTGPAGSELRPPPGSAAAQPRRRRQSRRSRSGCSTPTPPLGQPPRSSPRRSSPARTPSSSPASSAATQGRNPRSDTTSSESGSSSTSTASRRFWRRRRWRCSASSACRFGIS